MMKSLHLVFALFISTMFYSCLVPPATTNRVIVPEDTLMRYRKFIPSDEQIISKDFQTVITELTDGSKRERIFYPEKYQCTNETTYSSGNPSVKNGSYKEWWDDGYPKVVGAYLDGLSTGDWKKYSRDTGELTKEVTYVRGKKQNTEKNYKNGKLVSTYEYDMGDKEGAFTLYDTLGVIINEGEYRADTLFSQSNFTKVISKTHRVVEKMPQFPGCEDIEDAQASKNCAQKKMLMFIYGGIKYPADARSRSIEGTAIVKFVVDKDGSIIELETIKGLSQTIEEECKRIISSMPRWNPGYQDGKPVKVQFNLPIKFKLQ